MKKEKGKIYFTLNKMIEFRTELYIHIYIYMYIYEDT